MTTVAEKVFSAVTNGAFDHDLMEILDTMDSCDVQSMINQAASYYGLDYYGTPLVIAARNGFENIVNILINRYHADIKKEGFVAIDEYLVVSASPLWCAAASGHLPTVKLLVEAGANVNHEIEYEFASTPVRCACSYGHLDIVRYLADNRADLNEPRKGRSCLMIACAKGHLDIVEFLLERGVDVYQKEEWYGSSAMHFAAGGGHLDIVKLLVNSGVKMQVNSAGMSPLMLAAVQKKMNVVEFLLEQNDRVIEKEKIDVLEILGASFANHRNRRFGHANDPHPKSESSEVNPASGEKDESKNLGKLEGIKADSDDALHTESLVIWERILNRHKPVFAESVIRRGEIYLYMGRFEECIPLYLQGFHLLRISKCSINRDFLLFFREFFRRHFNLKSDDVKAVLEAALEELARLKVKISDSENVDRVREYGIMHHTLCMILIITKMKNILSKAQIGALEQLIRDIVNVKAVTTEGYTLLHLSVDACTSDNVCRFPCADTAVELIRRGADVNAMDNDRNTPLHTVLSRKILVNARNRLAVQTIVSALLNAKCHCDTVNSYGYTPMLLASKMEDPFGVLEIFESEWKSCDFNLMCLASRVIIRHRIRYENKVPTIIQKYIELHGRW